MADGFTELHEKIIVILLKPKNTAADVIAHADEIIKLMAEDDRITVAIQGLEMLDPVCRCNMKGPAQEFGHITGCLAMTALKILKHGPAKKKVCGFVGPFGRCEREPHEEGMHAFSQAGFMKIEGFKP
jgi:hypothetical protein